jgi:hypothetical protein
MKTMLILAIALFSFGTFADSEDFRENVKVQAESAQMAYDKAVDLVAEIKSTRGRTSLPYLKKCNLRPNQQRDNFFFRRKAWTNSSWVSLNHVTGMYTAIVKVACTIRDRD